MFMCVTFMKTSPKRANVDKLCLYQFADWASDHNTDSLGFFSSLFFVLSIGSEDFFFLDYHLSLCHIPDVLPPVWHPQLFFLNPPTSVTFFTLSSLWQQSSLPSDQDLFLFFTFILLSPQLSFTFGYLEWCNG